MKFKTAKLNHEGVWDVDVQEVLDVASDCTLIDVRRPEEYVGELGHIKGAKLLTLETEFAEGIKKHSREEVIVLICRSGARSSRAAAYAKAIGYDHVYNMSGGMVEWNSRHLPTE